MPVNRRRFLQQSAFAAAACAASPLFAWERRRPDLDGGPDGGPDHGHDFAHPLAVSRQAFEGLIGASFQVSPRSGNGSPVWLRLQAVEDPPALVPVSLGSFAVLPKVIAPVITTSGYILTFSGPGTSLSQKTYIFENERLGKFPLFIVPLGPDLYIAVFNLLNAPPRGRFITPTEEHPGPASSPGKTPSEPRPAPVMGKPGEPANGDDSGIGRRLPEQEQMDPALRDRFKTELPE